MTVCTTTQRPDAPRRLARHPWCGVALLGAFACVDTPDTERLAGQPPPQQEARAASAAQDGGAARLERKQPDLVLPVARTVGTLFASAVGRRSIGPPTPIAKAQPRKEECKPGRP
jgi:hypothetical protein